MYSQYYLIFAMCAFVSLFYAVDRYRIRRAKKRNQNNQCALCCAKLVWSEYEEIAVGGGELFRTTARICKTCARREKYIAWSAAATIILAFVATIILQRL